MSEQTEKQPQEMTPQERAAAVLRGIEMLKARYNCDVIAYQELHGAAAIARVQVVAK